MRKRSTIQRKREWKETKLITDVTDPEQATSLPLPLLDRELAVGRLRVVRELLAPKVGDLFPLRNPNAVLRLDVLDESVRGDWGSSVQIVEGHEAK
jgi:hypothetical protein